MAGLKINIKHQILVKLMKLKKDPQTPLKYFSIRQKQNSFMRRVSDLKKPRDKL